jgi:hypothetical protein
MLLKLPLSKFKTLSASDSGPISSSEPATNGPVSTALPTSAARAGALQRFNKLLERGVGKKPGNFGVQVKTNSASVPNKFAGRFGSSNTKTESQAKLPGTLYIEQTSPAPQPVPVEMGPLTKQEHDEKVRRGFVSAVMNNDANGVESLIKSGAKPYGLDDKGVSPVNLIISQYQSGDLEKACAIKLYKALCASNNLSAPQAYVKPFARHGTSSAGEIFMSGGLQGSPMPGKKGVDYLGEKIFLTTPTRFVEDMGVVRDSRQISRSYASPAVGSELQHSHRKAYSIFSQALFVLEKESISPETLMEKTGRPREIYLMSNANTNRATAVQDAVVSELVECIQSKIIGKLHNRNIENLTVADYKNVFSEIKLPTKIEVAIDRVDQGMHEVTQSDVLLALKKIQADSVKNEIGLSTLNKGAQVPVVLGFSPIVNLDTHKVSRKSGDLIHHYRNTALPLGGDENGGRLIELEMRSPEHLSTLLLHAEIENYVLPEAITVRLKKEVNDNKRNIAKPREIKSDLQKAETAVYISGDQLTSFKASVKKEVNEYIQASGVSDVGKLDRLQRQDLNDHLHTLAGKILRKSLLKDKADFSQADPLPGIKEL